MPTREASAGSATRPPSTSPQEPLRLRDESDPWRRSVELAQRARITLDVAAVDLEAAEASLGALHPTTWFFRNSLNEARTAWERLCAEVGLRKIEAALKEPPVAVINLRSQGSDHVTGHPEGVVLISITGQTYRAQRIAGTASAPIQWRLTRLHPPLEDGPYFACRLDDGSTQCDCAGWTYQADPTGRRAPCKHLKALTSLGWI